MNKAEKILMELKLDEIHQVALEDRTVRTATDWEQKRTDICRAIESMRSTIRSC